MKRIAFFVLLLTLSTAQLCRAQTIFSLNSSDFGITDTFNNINSFEFNIELAGGIAPGVTYTNPVINSIDYQVFGTLPNPTPSGFPGFALSRSYTGTDFYAQSPESGLDFTIDASADLSDGLQLSELLGTGSDPIFTFNAREFDQAPGRYHPPVLTLLANGTGRLENANNQSIFPNPPPPSGSGLLVDVDFGEEYISDLTFNPSAITVATVPEPSSLALISSLMLVGFARRRKVTS